MNPTLKFSHRQYWKFDYGACVPKTAVLLGVQYVENLRGLPTEFLDYDTTFKNKDGQLEKYPLDLDKPHLILFFYSKNLFFTTIRTWSQEKQRYYTQLLNRTFDIMILDKR